MGNPSKGGIILKWWERGGGGGGVDTLLRTML